MIETEEVRTNKLPPVSTIGDGLHILAVTSLADEAATVLVPAEEFMLDNIPPNITVDTISLNTAYAPTGLEPIGTAFWDDLTRTWVIRTGLDTYLSLGAELSPTCKNGDSFTHLNGQPCYISSGTGKLTVLKLASASTHTASNIIYLATQDVLHTGNGRGKYTSYGAANTIPYTNVIKTGEDYALWAEGKELYLCDELGKLSVVKLPAPYHSNLVGYISDKSGSNISIEVHPSLGFELGEMHDVDLTKSKTTPIDTDVFLLRDSEDSNIWKKISCEDFKAIASGGGGVVDNNTLTGEGTEENPFQISEEYKLRINAGI